MKRGWALALATLVALSLVGSACSSAAPTPTQVPAVPTKQAATEPPALKTGANPSPAAKSASTAVSATKPAGPTPAAAEPALSADWKADWDKSVAGARQEGKVVLAGGPGELYRNAMMAFQKAYPDIRLDYTGVRGPEFEPKILAERNGGQYLWDVHIGGWNGPLPFISRGVLDPLQPALLLPEVLDDSKWLDGFADGWVDKEGKYIFQYASYLGFMGYVNREFVPESEFTSIEQLLDPRWKGRISSQNPRVPGPISSYLGYVLSVKGEGWVRKLFGQDLVIMQGAREQLDAIIRGSYPIGLAVDRIELENFRREGLATNVKPIDPENAAGRRLAGGINNLTLVNRAPHPNAARVFVNWLLSKEGQKTYVEETGQNSRRLDVIGPSETAPNPGVKYEIKEREGTPLDPNTTRAIEIAKEMLK